MGRTRWYSRLCDALWDGRLRDTGRALSARAAARYSSTTKRRLFPSAHIATVPQNSKTVSTNSNLRITVPFKIWYIVVRWVAIPMIHFRMVFAFWYGLPSWCTKKWWNGGINWYTMVIQSVKTLFDGLWYHCRVLGDRTPPVFCCSGGCRASSCSASSSS